jgi:hypothetical protein
MEGAVVVGQDVMQVERHDRTGAMPGVDLVDPQALAPKAEETQEERGRGGGADAQSLSPG